VLPVRILDPFGSYAPGLLCNSADTGNVESMRKLIWGIVEFRERELPQYAAHFRDLASGQSPDTLFITCADSRVVPNLLVSTDPGELFTMRNVGNLVPPATPDGLSTGDLSEASAIEYAVKVLKVANIVVCGHSGCGAMKAILAPGPIDDAPNLAAWLDHARPAASRLFREAASGAGLAQYDRLSQLNVLVQLEHLMTYPDVRGAVENGATRLSAWWFDIATGDMYAWQDDTRSFAVIDRPMAERLTGGG
jgi:carbonic anhydrase